MDSEERAVLLRRAIYFDLKTKKDESLDNFLGRNQAVILLMSAYCPSCPVHRKMLIIKEIAEEYGSKVKCMILFGQGNDPGAIAEFMGMNQMPGVGFGVLEQKSMGESYYRMFDFDIDPRIIILDRNGQCSYQESARDAGRIGIEVLRGKMNE